MVRPWANEWIHGVPSDRRMILALQRPYSTPSSGSARVSPSKRSGSASTSPTVQPARSWIVEGQHDIRVQHALALAFDDLARVLLRLAGALDEALRLHSRRIPHAPCATRAPAVAAPSPSVSSSLAVSTIDSGGHAATVSSTSPSTATGRRLSLSCLQRRHQDRPALEHQPFRSTHHAVDDRAFEQRAAGADHHPAQTSEPTTLVQRLQEALDIGAVLHRRRRRASRLIRAAFSPVSERNNPALVERRVTRAASPKAGSTDTSAGQKPPMLFSLCRNGGRHALGVVIEQRERRSRGRRYWRRCGQ